VFEILITVFHLLPDCWVPAITGLVSVMYPTYGLQRLEAMPLMYRGINTT